MDNINLSLPSCPINYEPNAVPTFFITKEAWTDEYKSIVRVACEYRRCFLVVKPIERLKLATECAVITVDSPYEFYKAKAQVDALLGVDEAANENEKKWKEYYDRWSERMLALEDKELFFRKAVDKYGNTRKVGDVNIFDALYEYAYRYGNGVEDDPECEPIINNFQIDGYDILLNCSKHATITITKIKKDRI